MEQREVQYTAQTKSGTRIKVRFGRPHNNRNHRISECYQCGDLFQQETKRGRPAIKCWKCKRDEAA